MLHVPKHDVFQRLIEFLALARRVRQRLPKGHADLASTESASHFDVMRSDEVIDGELYARGIELLERIVAMLTKLVDP